MTCDRVIHLHTHMNNWDMVELALRVHHKQHHPPTDDDDDE